METPQTGPFNDAYTALNLAQKQAVDAIEGPVMVIAGPGTGKTQILALRIANILDKTDTAPSSVLALTFTEAGVASMRKRLASLIGARGYQVRIHTFHGFCNTIIKRYPERFPRIVGSEQVLEIDGLHIIEGIIDRNPLSSLRPPNHAYLYVRDIKSTISESKRENVSPAELLTRIAVREKEITSASDLYHEKGAHKGKMKGAYSDALKQLEKAREFAKVYRLYEEELTRTHLYDFDDTILEVVHSLEIDEELKLILQEEHQYLLADEHQDANGAQNRLLELLSDFHESPNLFIVGDEKQAIYRFQGASLENFLYFKRRYQDAVLIELTSNYRGTQVLLDAAHDVIVPTSGDHTIARPRLRAERMQETLPVALRISQDSDTELADMAESIKEKRDAGAEGHEIAILLRRNSDVGLVASFLERKGIQVASQNDGQIFNDTRVRSFVSLLRAVVHFGDDAYLYPLLFSPFVQISNLDVYRLTEKPDGARVSLYETLSSKEVLAKKGISDISACRELFNILDESATFAKGSTPGETALFAFERSGIAQYLAKRADMHTALEYIRACIDYIGGLSETHSTYTLKDILKSIDSAHEYGLSLLPHAYELAGYVRVQTVHRAKGLEYDHVYIPFLHDGRWGMHTSRAKIHVPLYTVKPDEETALDDERRLLYVAMTRARKTLTLSYAEMGKDGRAQVPSRFLADIGEEHIEKADVKMALADVLAKDILSAQNGFAEEVGYARARLEAQGLSVSALNNYLESPWKYFFQNLLRMPTPREKYLYYGTAMDATLKWLTEEERAGATVVPEDAVQYFDQKITAMPLLPSDKEAYRERGAKAISGYVGKYVRSDEPNTLVEAGVGVSAPFETRSEEIPTITLRGEYDRLETLDADTIRVVDFKTGVPKSRPEIEGKTKSSNGNYKRQLVFYALLAELDHAHSRHVKEGVIDFVEPDSKGEYHRELFIITKEEIDELRVLVQKTVSEIATLAFFDTPCDAETWSEQGAALVEAYKLRFQ